VIEAIIVEIWSTVTRIDRFYDMPCFKHGDEETPQSMHTSRSRLQRPQFCVISASLPEFGIVVSEINAGKVA
jgi:hypothetical protein